MKTVLNMDNDEMESLWLKKTILSTFKELLIKFQHTEWKHLLTVFILNGSLNEYKAKGVSIFNNFELSIKLNYLTLDEVALYIMSKIQGDANEQTYK